MRNYETLLLLSPDLNAENKKGVIDTLTGIIEREQGSMVTVDDWGTKDLAYPVRKFLRGQFVRLEYSVNAQAVAELERIIRITDGIFKFVTVKLVGKAQPAEAVEA